MLVAYYMTRFKCAFCGTFETWTQDRPDPAAKCPWCDEDLETAAQCRGMTSRPLPYTSDPRLDEQVRGTGIDQLNNQVSDNRRRRHGHGKSTGRKRGGEGRAIYRGPSDQADTGDADRERHRKNKRPVDFNSQPEV
jgi:hypothetical protein